MGVNSSFLTQKHQIQASTTTAGREQEEKFSGSPDNENTNKEKGNSFVANSLKLLWDEVTPFLTEHLRWLFLVFPCKSNTV